MQEKRIILFFVSIMVWITILFTLLIYEISLLPSKEAVPNLSLPSGPILTTQNVYVVPFGKSILIIDRAQRTVEVLTQKGNSFADKIESIKWFPGTMPIK